MAFDPAVLDSDTLTNKQTKNGATRMLHDQDRRDTNRLGRAPHQRVGGRRCDVRGQRGTRARS